MPLGNVNLHRWPVFIVRVVCIGVHQLQLMLYSYIEKESGLLSFEH